jgi:hypothetical protein
LGDADGGNRAGAGAAGTAPIARQAEETGDDMLTGRCLCGGSTYEIDGDPVVVAHCHCQDCQRLSGAGHTTGAMFAEGGVRMWGPIARYATTSDAGNDVVRLFCATCGSPLFGRNSGMPGFITATAGTLDQSDDLAPQVAIFARNRRAWDPADPSVASFEAQPDWTPDKGV